MSRRILIQGGEVALMEDKRLLYFSSLLPDGVRAEQIYLGVVDRIVKGMEAAFVRLNTEQMGFLPFAECREKPRSGDKILVQVKKPPVGDKAPYLTEDLSFAGRFSLLTPLLRRCAVSKRVEEEAEKQRLQALAQRLAPENMGLVLRTEALAAGVDEIAREVAALRAVWEEVLQASQHAQAPCLIRDRADALARLLRDEHGALDEILTDQMDSPILPGIPVHYCQRPFDLFSVKAKLEKSMQRKVWLDCGGYLVIDRTEALTVIDVNSGKFTGGKAGTESTFLRLNTEAAREIARLLRLRNLGGIIIIDFVDMQQEASRAAVQEALKEALKQDPVKTVIHGFTSLGLMEMTRRKTEESI